MLENNKNNKKKNILLVGVPRAGKSTFAKMILKEFPDYHFFQEDIISNAYISAARDIAIKKRESNNKAVKVVFDLDFACKLFYYILGYSVLYESKLNFIFDGSYVDWEEIRKYNTKDMIVIVFGYPSITKKEAIENISKYDTKEDWTYIESSWTIDMLFETNIPLSQEYQKKCQELGIRFVDTSYQRKKVLQELLVWVKEQI